jgi:FAD/FMN-containing dehydrogenase
MEFVVRTICILSIAALPCLAKTPEEIRADLSGQLSSGSEIILTSNGSYSTGFTQRWTVYVDAEPTYSVAAKPVTVEDVQAIVQYAARNNVSFMATGGGHGYSTTLSGVQDALDVDLSNFKGVSVDALANTMTIGGATIFADIYDPLYHAGKQIRECFMGSNSHLKLI